MPVGLSKPLGEKSDPLLGTVINGKFRIVSLLARGGMGRIYSGEQVPLGRSVAVKVLRSRYPDDAASEAQFLGRFFREASILSKLQHPNIVTLFDYGRIEGVEGEQYFMAMEYLHGETLARRLRTRGRMSPADAIVLLRQVARGVREAHRHGVVHRDLKPANIMLVPDDDGSEVVKVLDFGIGKILNEEPGGEDLTNEGSFVGTPKYMAPEQVLNRREADERADIYSLGVMFFECICGRPPFEADTPASMLMAQCSLPPPRMSTFVPDVPESLDTLVQQALEKDPARRPATMDEVVRALRLCEESMTGVPISTATSSIPVSRPSWSAVSESTTKDAPLPDVAASGPKSMERRWVLPTLISAALVTVLLVVLLTRRTATGHATKAASEAAPIESFSLAIETTPPGAEVRENGNLLGTTPVFIPITRTTVQRGPRTFVLFTPGYLPYVLTQSDSERDVRVEIPLPPAAAPATSASTASAANAPSARAKIVIPPKPTVRPPATSEPAPLIKTQR